MLVTVEAGLEAGFVGADLESKDVGTDLTLELVLRLRDGLTLEQSWRLSLQVPARTVWCWVSLQQTLDWGLRQNLVLTTLSFPHRYPYGSPHCTAWG